MSGLRPAAAGDPHVAAASGSCRWCCAASSSPGRRSPSWPPTAPAFDVPRRLHRRGRRRRRGVGAWRRTRRPGCCSSRLLAMAWLTGGPGDLEPATVVTALALLVAHVAAALAAAMPATARADRDARCCGGRRRPPAAPPPCWPPRPCSPRSTPGRRPDRWSSRWAPSRCSPRPCGGGRSRRPPDPGSRRFGRRLGSVPAVLAIFDFSTGYQILGTAPRAGRDRRLRTAVRLPVAAAGRRRRRPSPSSTCGWSCRRWCWCGCSGMGMVGMSDGGVRRCPRRGSCCR